VFQQRHPDAALAPPARHHHRRLELDAAVAREHGAAPAVEERVFFEQAHGVGGGVEGGGAGVQAGGGGVQDGEEGGAVGEVGGGGEVGACYVAGAAVDYEAGVVRGGGGVVVVHVDGAGAWWGWGSGVVDAGLVVGRVFA